VGRLLHVVAVSVAGLLAVLGGRRALFLVAAVWPPRRVGTVSGELPSLLVALAARNEERGILRALEALADVAYPSERMLVVLVDDGSMDRTLELLREFAATRAHVRVVSRNGAPNKAAALNAALAASAPTDLVVVCDADQAPAPDCFHRLAGAFEDPQVGAAAAYLRPANADTSVVARYTAVETWLHQFVTSAAKDRLALDPPMLGGGSMYRRVALDEIGGFPGRPYGEDLGTSLLLARAGWRTRFVPEAVVDNLVAADSGDYWNQHLRWTRIVYSGAEPSIRWNRLSGLRRVEQALQRAGYADRLALGGAFALAAIGRLPRSLPAGYLGIVAGEVVVGAVKAGMRRRLPTFLLATALVFPLDVAGAVAATASHLARRPFDWRSPRRGSMR
jgi:glycosyltransferase involved in cell wall biosynthesis